MPEQLTYPPGTTTSTATLAVYTRDEWSEAWLARPDLRCVSCSFAASPSISAAVFRHRYGQRYQTGTIVGDVVPRLNINPRSYVKVVITPSPGMTQTPITWIGIWRSFTDLGLEQPFHAVGLEALLDWTVVSSSWYVDVFGGLQRAGFGLTFNDRGLPNRTRNKHPILGQQAYCFEENEEQAEYWSTRDIVEYLLEGHPPLDETDDPILVWALNNSFALPSYDRPVVKSHDRSVLNLLHGLIARQRLIGFRLSYVDVPATSFTPAMNAALVNIFTFTESDISLTDVAGTVVGVIPANTNVITINLDRDTTARTALSIEASHVADRVTVTGAARQSVFSVSKLDGSLDRAWTDAEEVAHIAGAGSASDYPVAGEQYGRSKRDKEARASDRMRRVFGWFQIPKFWDQLTYAGEGATDAEGQLIDASPIALSEELDGQGDPLPFRIPQQFLTPLRELPLRHTYVYADATIADAEAAGTAGHRGTPTGPPPHKPYDLVSIFAVIRQPDYLDRFGHKLDPPTELPPKYVQIDQIGKSAGLESQSFEGLYHKQLQINRDWSGRVSALADFRGFEVTVSGAEQHVLGKIEYGGEADQIRGSWSWQDMIVTIAVRDPRLVTVQWPEEWAEPEDQEGFHPIGEFVNDLRIDAGDTYQQIYVVPDTIVGLDETTGELIRSTGGYLQDDRDALKVIAQRAYEWYRVPRYQLSYSTSWIDGRLAVGMFVQSYRRLNQLDPVGSVITSIIYEFPISGNEKPHEPKCSVNTQYGELDATRVI